MTTIIRASLPADWATAGLFLADPDPFAETRVFVAPRTLERLLRGDFVWGNPHLPGRIAAALVAADWAAETGRGHTATDTLRLLLDEPVESPHAIVIA